MDIKEINAIESETGIIATLIHHPEFVFHSEQLSPDCFTDKNSREISIAIEDLARRDIKNVDAYNIK